MGVNFFNILLALNFLMLLWAGAPINRDSTQYSELEDDLISLQNKEQIDSAINKAYALNYSDPEQALNLAENALIRSKELSYTSGIASAYSKMAIVFKNTGKYEKGIAACDSALKYSSFINNSEIKAQAFNTKGTIYYYQSKYRLAINWYERSLEIYKSREMASHAATLLNNIGLALSELADYNQALDYYFEALKIHEQENHKEGIALTLANIGIVYFNLGNLDKAMEFYGRSLNIRLEIKDDFGIASCYTNMGNVYISLGKSDTALNCYRKALRIFQNKKDINNVASTYLLFGYYFISNGDYDSALIYYDKVLQIGKEIKSENNIAHASLNLGFCHINLGNYDEAFDYLLLSKRFFEKTGDRNMLQYPYRALTDYYELVGKYDSSLAYYKKYSDLHDSLLRVESSKRITEAELLYDSEKQENKIALLTKEKQINDIQLQKQKQYRNTLIVGALVIILFTVFLIWRFFEKQKANKLLRLKNEELAKKSQQIQNQNRQIEEQIERLKELDETKAKFFANISHEFRTPLTLIKGPVEDVLRSHENKLIDERRRNLEVSLENINKLRKLIDQILDLAKLQSGKLKLRTHRQDLIAFLNRQINSFQSALARKPGLNLSFHHADQKLFLYFDENKLETIFINILSNAVKYSAGKGELKISVENGRDHTKPTGNFIRIKISDDGIGIKPEELEHIFSRFYRSQSASNSNLEGTGIGLELTKELVALHGGEICVESEYGKGTTFIIDLPEGKDHLSNDEIVLEAENEMLAQTYMSAKVEKSGSQKNATIPQEFEGARQKILLVEDNTEMRNYILGHLKGNFEVLEAENGKEGLEKALKEMPDLIISDLMMPVMDGLQFLQKVRENKLLHDVAFIMLTARADEEDRLSGYKAKADEYITKPFSSEELILRVSNLLYTRKHLEEKYSRKVINIDFEDKNLIPADKEFLNRMKAIVIENIANTGFEMKDFAAKAFLSERQLRRKLNEISGVSPVEFIRQIRLLKAKELLENKVYFSIAEVSAAVGFNNPHYFSKMFRKMFGLTPNDQLGKKIS